MKILMLGWEYPPSITGGLGIASHGIAESLAQIGHQITFLLPKKDKKQQSKIVKLVDASTMAVDPQFWIKTSESVEEIEDAELGSEVMAYLPPRIFKKTTRRVAKEKVAKVPSVSDEPLTGKYDDGLLNETGKYALLAVQYASEKNIDLVYCHDWPTFKAGIMIKEILGKPMAVHVHSTEFERNGVYTNPIVIQEEGKGIKAADFVFAVSSQTRKTVIEKYPVKMGKITVVPNAGPLIPFKKVASQKRKPTLAFIGRFTHQKSPATFIDIARELTSKGRDYEYVMIGDGYLYDQLAEKSRNLNLADRLKFPGFLSHKKVLESMSQIDLLIAPSNAEPFGIVMLEAMLQEVPVISSPGSGLSEFIPELPEADRWDIYNCTTLAERLIEDQGYRSEVVKACLKKAKSLTWDKTAKLISETIAK